MDRRPIASRGTKWANALAKYLSKENISPNQISLISVAFSIFSFIFYSVAKTNSVVLILAALFIQLRLICNLLDGMVAIEYNKKSIYGNLFNDIPDRFADVFIIMGAGIYAYHSEKSFSYSLELAWGNAILAVLTAYIRVLGASLGTPMFFSGIMAKPQRMALLTITSFLALIPQNSIPFFSIALVLMFAGQCITVIQRIRLISIDLKLRNKNE